MLHASSVGEAGRKEKRVDGGCVESLEDLIKVEGANQGVAGIFK